MLVNLTPHELSICSQDGTTVLAKIPSSGSARVVTSATKVAEVTIDSNIVDVVETSYGEVEGLPEAANETTYVVSILVINALKALGIVRNDVVAPDTGPQSVVRDSSGNILGVRRFTR